jgi:hypothetical protein
MEIGPEEGSPGNDPHPQKEARLKEHRRRQRTFAYSCMRYLHQKDRDCTLITDIDEFLVFNNPPHAESENIILYDIARRGHWKKHIDQERESVHGLRGALPPLYDPTTTTKVESDYDSEFHNRPGMHILGLSILPTMNGLLKKFKKMSPKASATIYS